MPLRNTAEAYGSVAKFLHWSIVLLILPQWFIAEAADELPRGAEKAYVLGWHKSLGLLVLLLAIARIVWKLVNRPHPAPIGDVVWQRKAAAAGHGLLYLLIFLQPISGWAMSSAMGRPVEFFGWFTLPALLAKNDALHEQLEEAHEVLFWTLVAVAVVHVAAAIYHHVVLRDDVLKRMLPFHGRPGR